MIEGRRLNAHFCLFSASKTIVYYWYSELEKPLINNRCQRLISPKTINELTDQFVVPRVNDMLKIDLPRTPTHPSWLVTLIFSFHPAPLQLV